jgi:hypothetical protein
MAETEPLNFINGEQCPQVEYVVAAAQLRNGWMPTEAMPDPRECGFEGVKGLCTNTHSIELISSAPGHPAEWRAITRDEDGELTDVCARDASAVGSFGGRCMLKALATEHRQKYGGRHDDGWDDQSQTEPGTL